MQALPTCITIPDAPADVDDDGQFRLVILGADYAGVVGDPPLPKAQEFLRIHYSAADIRTYQNIVLVVTPSVTGLHQAEQQIVEWLAWEEIKSSTQFKELDGFQQDTVRKKEREALKDAQTAVKNAYELDIRLDGLRPRVPSPPVAQGSHIRISAFAAAPSRNPRSMARGR